MRHSIFLLSAIFYISLATALPWPVNLFVRGPDNRLMPRDDPPPSPASSASPHTASNTASAAPSGTQTGSAPTGKPSGDSNDNKGNQTSSISIDPQSPAGGLSMVNPAPTTTTYYKYGDMITWVWNYTSLIVTPNAVDVLVSCQDTASTFTVAQNVSVNATQSITWDTSQETGAGITDKYTLVVYNADDPAGVSATAAPGKFAVYDQFVFAIYTKQPYQGYAQGYKCVTCNGAMSSAERQAIGVILAMASLTVFSFGYFANGFLGL